MARHKQFKKLGGSCNAVLTAPQGVTYQTFIQKKKFQKLIRRKYLYRYIQMRILTQNTTQLLQREGG